MAKRNLHVLTTRSSSNRLRNDGSCKSYASVQHFQLFENQNYCVPQNQFKECIHNFSLHVAGTFVSAFH